MNRTAMVIALTLMLATGLILGQLRGLSSPMPAALPDSDPLALQTATSFYAAVNMLLESGDPSSLRALLHPSFVDHVAVGEQSGTALDLETSLLERRTSFPDLRIQTTSPILGGNLVASSLIATGNAHGQMHGVAFEAQLNAPGFDLLRVASGVVLDHWAGYALPEPPQIELLASVAIDRLSTARTLKLERLVFEPSSSRTLSKQEGTIIIVESGSISIRLSTYGEESYSGTPAVPNSGDQLAAGDIALIPAGSPFSLETTGLQTASVLQLRIEALQPGDQSEPETERREVAPGVDRELLLHGSFVRPNDGPFILSMRLVTLAPGTAIAKHRIAETEFVWVMDGTVQVAIDNGDVEMLTGQGTVTRRSELLDLHTAQGITADTGTEAAYRAAGHSSATFLLVTLSQDVPSS